MHERIETSYRHVYRILPVQFLTRALTAEYVPAVDLLVVLLQIMVTFSEL